MQFRAAFSDGSVSLNKLIYSHRFSPSRSLFGNCNDAFFKSTSVGKRISNNASVHVIILQLRATFPAGSVLLAYLFTSEILTKLITLWQLQRRLFPHTYQVGKRISKTACHCSSY